MPEAISSQSSSPFIDLATNPQAQSVQKKEDRVKCGWWGTYLLYVVPTPSATGLISKFACSAKIVTAVSLSTASCFFCTALYVAHHINDKKNSNVAEQNKDTKYSFGQVYLMKGVVTEQPTSSKAEDDITKTFEDIASNSSLE